MKIRKRHQPVDFQTIGDDPSGLSEPLAQTSTLDPEDSLGPYGEAAPQPAPAFAPLAGAPLAPTPRKAEVTTASPRMPAPRPEFEAAMDDDLPPAWPIYLAAFVVSVLWACAPIAFAWGYRRSVAPFDYDPFAFAVFALLALGPALFVWLAAYMIRQGQKLSAETRRAKALADDLVSPVVAAGVRTSDIVRSMQEEIANAAAAAEDARETLLALRQAVSSESEMLIQATAHSARTATELSTALGRERTEMATLAGTLDGQAASVAEAITRQARMVAEASDLAQTQLREAEAALAARAADLTAAAGETSDAARTAADDLTRHIARLETAGLGVREQISTVEAGLTE